MNVDIGLLYAASVIAESGNLCSGKVLPGQRLYWRDDFLFFAKPLSIVTKTYAKMKRKEGIVSSMLTLPKYLEALHKQAHKMF